MTDTTEVLRQALERMDRARDILTDGKPRPECRWGLLDTSDLREALAAPAAADGEPVATLHDDGCFTWKRDEFRLMYDRQRAGWRMDVYAAAPSAVAPLPEGLKWAIASAGDPCTVFLRFGTHENAAAHVKALQAAMDAEGAEDRAPGATPGGQQGGDRG